MDFDRNRPRTGPARPETAPRAASPRRAPLAAPGGEMTRTRMLALQGDVGNRNAHLALQRADTETAGPSRTGDEAEETASQTSSQAVSQASSRLSERVRTARRALATSISTRTGTGRIDNNGVKKALLKRLKAGPPFSPADMENIRTIAERNRRWLDDVGIGTYEDAEEYLRTGKYYTWLKLRPGRRILIASIAWERGRLRGGRDREGDIPNTPAYTLGRTLALHGVGEDGTAYLDEDDQTAHANERDRQIRSAFVRTLDEGSWPANSAVTEEHTKTNQRALTILTKVLLILQNGLKVYSESAKGHVDYQQGDVARALAHGGRVNIRIPETGGEKNARAFTDYLGLTELAEETGRHRDANPAERRTIGTHRMHIRDNRPGRRGKFEERGGLLPAGAQNLAGYLIEDRPIYGPNAAVDGLGNTDFNGDVILPNGAHGHMFLAFTPPRKNRDGALQVGIETLAPGRNDSPVGYRHTVLSSEKTANPESNFYGHKQDKIGEGKLSRNQRYVDLAEFNTADGGWERFLHDMQAKWDAMYEAAKDDDDRRRALYERLVGPRGDHFRPDSAA